MENTSLYNRINALPLKVKEEVLDFMEFLIEKNKIQPVIEKPIHKPHPPVVRKLGILESKASFKIKGDFKITDEEFLSL
jgi:hypothetical protein